MQKKNITVLLWKIKIICAILLAGCGMKGSLHPKTKDDYPRSYPPSKGK
ncbi:hypothetical protein P618_200011 [Holospora obtusa F1]|uniref:Lipoprotein n=1 Tax=Holospora obtusa F1 TaxID=1399147 RepID=W6TFH6_HOLOB|nr:lipoprotein [Holospora obtusa]ETZ07771.1 hypothetical protein P618_200011 [Holospora obtusa F1]